MVLDIVFIAIIILCAVSGFRKGFGYTFIHMASWIISIVLAFMATPYVKDFIHSKTDIYNEVIPVIPAVTDVPDIVSGSIIAVTSEMIFTIVSFLAVFICIKLILGILMFILTRSNRDGFVGIVDGIFGGLFGLLKGVILILVLITVMIPLADIFLPDFAPRLESAVTNSYLTDMIYNKNPLLLLLQGFFV